MAKLADKSAPRDLPYRPCVGIMLINDAGLVWVGRRLPKWSGDRSAYIWQMPQGGINSGEEPRAAALRELEEETAVRSSSVVVLAEAGDWLTYDLPPNLLGVALKGRYRGQRQKWFVMRFTGRDEEINIVPARPNKAEFDAWRWEKLQALPGLIVDFKRKIYEDLVRDFGHLAAR